MFTGFFDAFTARCCVFCEVPDFRGSFWGVVGKTFTRLPEFVREEGILAEPSLPYRPYPNFRPHPTLSVDFPNLTDEDEVERECFGAACTMLADGSLNAVNDRTCYVYCWLHYVPVGETDLDNAVAAFGRVPVGAYVADAIPTATVGTPTAWLVNDLAGDPEVWDSHAKLDIHLDDRKAFVGPNHVGWIHKRYSDSGRTNRIVYYTAGSATPTELIWHNNSYSKPSDCTVASGSVGGWTEPADRIVDVSRTRFPLAVSCRTEVRYTFAAPDTGVVSEFTKIFDQGEIDLTDGTLDRPNGFPEEDWDLFKEFPMENAIAGNWRTGITRPSMSHLPITDAMFRTPVLEFEMGRFRRPETQLVDNYYGTLLLMSTARFLDQTPHEDDEVNTTLLWGNLHFGFTGTGAEYGAGVFESHLTYDEVEDGLTTSWREPNDALDPYDINPLDPVASRSPIRQYANYAAIDIGDDPSCEPSFQFLTRAVSHSRLEGTAGVTMNDIDSSKANVGKYGNYDNAPNVTEQALMASATVRTAHDAQEYNTFGVLESYRIITGQAWTPDADFATGYVTPHAATIGGDIATATDKPEDIYVITPFYDSVTTGTVQPMPQPTGFWEDRTDPENPVLRRGRFCFAARYDDHSPTEADIFAGYTPPSE